MLYSTILIDVFNLIYKKRDNETASKNIANNVIDFIEHTVKPKLESESSKIYLLFDPMPSSDLNVSSQFRTFTSTRKAIKASYKANREKDPIILEVADYLLKYFSYRDPMYYLVYSEKHEADDYVESLVVNSGKTLLISSDYDWARYLSKDVEMSIGDINHPFTVSNYLEKFGFFPSIKNVTVYKALMGDPSDNIEGIFSKKFPFMDLGTEAVKFISKKDESLNDFITRIKSYTFKNLFEIKNRNLEEELFYQMHCFEKSNLVSHFLLNVSLIRSNCVDASKFVKNFQKKDSGFCTLINSVLGREETKKKSFRFGKVKL